MQQKFIFFLYRALLNSSFAFLVLYLLRRVGRNPAYRRGLAERFGFLPGTLQRTEAGAVWLHAVSVGEVLSVLPLVLELKAAFPRRPIYVSCGTVAGREAAETKLTGLVDGIFYAPLDLVCIVRRVLRRIRPALLLICETEIWPNLWRETRRSGARVVVVNGRISDKSLPRYRKIRWLLRPVFAQADAIFTQSEVDTDRYRELGAGQEQVECLGNLKYDFKPSAGEVAAPLEAFLSSLPPHWTWIAASTVGPVRPGDVDEDDAVLDAFTSICQERPQLLLLIAPRKPERFDEVAAKLDTRGIAYARRSRLPNAPPVLPFVLLLDTIGELASLFVGADVVFMGGTLADRGGHNVLEPAACRKPIVVGPHLENFEAIALEFRSAKAFVEIDSRSELAGTILQLLRDPGPFGARALKVANGQQGVTKRLSTRLEQWYDLAVPTRVPFLPATVLLGPLAGIWRIAAGVHRRLRLSRQVRLKAPVISVGNLSAGGTGKTPFVLWLAEWLASEGERPAILTRGYRRQRSEAVTILRRGEAADVEKTGDEAQILLRSGYADIGIGADRASVGEQMESGPQPSVFLLDDGFQHVRLARDADVVLIDSLDPLAGGDTLPLGRLREPLSALTRADAVVITRTEAGRSYLGIKRAIAAVKPTLPVYLARLTARWWRSVDGETLPPEHFRGKKVAAFCGLGNPAAFWLTLDQLNYEVVLRQPFPDHHRYSPDEIESLIVRARRRGAEAILTTEKDRYNLLNPISGEMPLHWLEVVLEVDNGEALKRLLRRRTERDSRAL